MRRAFLLAALLVAGCLGQPALPPSTGVHAQAFAKDGGAWRAYHLAWCGLCGPDSPSRLFVVFADGKLLLVDFVAKTGAPVRVAPGVAYDASEIASVLRDVGGNVTSATTAAVDDPRVVTDLATRWHPQDRVNLTCADFAARYGFWPAGGAPDRVDLACPPDQGAPMQPFASQLERLEANVLALRQAR